MAFFNAVYLGWNIKNIIFKLNLSPTLPPMLKDELAQLLLHHVISFFVYCVDTSFALPFYR